jgi:hypothetical protein
MLDILKNLKFLKVIFIIVAIVLALNVITFILAYWKLLAFAVVAYVGYKIYQTTFK